MSQVTYHDEYSEDAICKFREFVNHATRHNNLKLEITDIKSIQITFEVNEIFDLVVASEEEKFKGVVSGSRNDLLIENDDHEYKTACSRLVHQQSTDHDIYQECRNTIAGFEFGKFHRQKDERFLIHSNQTAVIHHFGCPECRQSGMESCANCDSTGILTCNACGGHGEISCSHCSGAGYRIEIRSHRDGDGHYRHEEVVLGCTCSNGSNRCSSCGGSGERECRSCDEGYVECHDCDATGWFSKVYKVSLWADYTIRSSDTTYSDNAKVSSLSEDFLKALDYKEPLEDHADLVYKETLEDQENLQIRVQRHFFAPSSMFVANLEFEGQRWESKIVFFGQQHYLLDAGCILDLVLKKDIEQLVKLTGKLSTIFGRQLEQKLFSAINVLLSSPILVQLLKFHAVERDKSTIRLEHNAHKSLSTDEINAMLKGIKRAFYILNIRRIASFLPLIVACYSLIQGLAYAYFRWLNNTSLLKSAIFFEAPSDVRLYSFITGCVLILLVALVREKKYQSRALKIFGENYLLMKKMNQTYFPRIIYAIFILVALYIFYAVQYT